MNEIATGIAGNLLNSGSLVITALMLVVLVLCVWVYMMYRELSKRDDEIIEAKKENIRLQNIIIDMAKDGYSVLKSVQDGYKVIRERVDDIWRDGGSHG